MNEDRHERSGITRKTFLRGMAAAGAGAGLSQSPLVSPAASATPDPSAATGTPAAPAASAAQRSAAGGGDLAGWVRTFVGTEPQEGTPSVFGGPMAGNTFPGAVVPFGMVQWSPDTVVKQPGGYSFTDSQIKGFSLTHLSGGGCDCYGDFPFMPYAGEVTRSPAIAPEQYAAGFSHDAESASPGCYGVRLDTGVDVELSVTERSGIGRFGYPDGTTATMLVNASGSAAGADDAEVRVGRDTVSGWVRSGMFCGADNLYQVYFWAEFDRPFASAGTWEGSTVSPAGGQGATASGPDCGAFVTFDTHGDRTVQVRVGISFTSVDNARANLRAESRGGFEAIRRAARAEWNRRLGAIRVEGGTPTERANFYTALYHTYLHPNLFSDVNGQYPGFDGKVHTAPRGHAQYANYSGWDIYRSQIQLLALLAPKETSDMMQSMVRDYQQSGQLPKWGLANGETYIMVGDPAAPILADAYAFGARDFDVPAALAAMVEQATKPNNVRPGIMDYQRLGYTPTDGQYGPHFYGAASTSLEYNTADFAVAELARRLGDDTTYATFMARAQYWQTLFDPSTGYIRPRLLDGSFVADFDPAGGTDFVEGNATQYTWMVPFNPRRLFDLLGGDAAVRARLDGFFSRLNVGLDKPYAWMGNEPTQQTPWLYDYAGAPYRTQEVVRRTLTDLYTPAAGGLAGNDDLGQTSSWYVWAAMGMYPQVPGRAELVLASPLFSRITIRSDDGRLIEVSAPQAATDAPYVQSLRVDGRPATKPWLPASFALRGGRLDYTLSTTANTTWGSDPADAPPSFRRGETELPR
jgi:predicted alpha-1,2-mannosidase